MAQERRRGGGNSVVKRTNRLFHSRKTVKDLISLVLCFISMTAVTLAWFYSGNEGAAETLELVSISSTELKISLDAENWNSELSIPFPENLVLSPVSGSGKENRMYQPVLPAGSDSAEEALYWKSSEYDPDAASNSFYYFPVYFRADRPGYVRLSEISIEPAAAPEERQNKSYTDKNGTEIAVSGTVLRPVEDTALYKLILGGRIITKDYIAGAARISLVNRTNTADSEALEDALILANDTYALSFAVNDGEASCTMNECGASVDSGSYYNGNEVVSCSSGNLNVFTESCIRNGTAVSILELQKTAEDIYEGQVDICLWIDGFDNEAKELLAGGKISAEMTFSFAEDAS